jgi:nucleolar MIF4G domain-containing protein 1
VAAAAAGGGGGGGGGGGDAGDGARLSTRARLLLELVVDLKNNKSKGVVGDVAPALGKWLSAVGLGDVAVGLAGLTWDKLTATRKVATWWEPMAGEGLGGDSLGELRGGGGGAGGGTLRAESGSLLRLAGEQRMNTEVRRRVFCVIMGADDCMDAAEKLMRLPLADKQDREVSVS